MTNLLFGWAAPFHRATELGDNSLCHNEQAVWHRFTANIKKLTWKDSWVTREVSVYTSDKYVPFRFLAVYESEEADLDAELVWTKKKNPSHHVTCWQLASCFGWLIPLKRICMYCLKKQMLERWPHTVWQTIHAFTLSADVCINHLRLLTAAKKNMYITMWCLFILHFPLGHW